VWHALVYRPEVTPGEAARLEADRAKLGEQEREFEESRRKREAELMRVELMARSTLARAQAERERAEREARQTAEARPEKAVRSSTPTSICCRASIRRRR